MAKAWSLLAALALGGCLCDGETFTETAYAEIRSYEPQINDCIAGRCTPLCQRVFYLGDEVVIDRCAITWIDRAPLPDAGASSSEPAIRGVQVAVTYTEQVACDYGDDDYGDDDYGDDDYGDDDWGDDESDDDDACDDYGCDDDWGDDEEEDDDDDGDWDDDDGDWDDDDDGG